MFLSLHKRGFSLVLAIAAVTSLLGLSLSPAQAAPADGDLSIVKIIDHQGTLEYEIVEADIANFLKKEVDAEYKAAKKAWSETRDAWKSEHGKEVPFADPQPIKPTFKVVAKGLASRSDAKVELDNIKSKGPFSVVQVIKGKEKETPEIILKDEIKFKQHALAKAYSEKIQEWVKAKKKAESSKRGQFNRPMPEKPKLKVLKNSLKSMVKANDYLARYSK